MNKSFLFRIFLLAVFAIAMQSDTANAQFFKKLAKDVKNATQQGVDQAATNRTENDAGNATDKAIDKVEHPNTKSDDKNSNQSNEPQNSSDNSNSALSDNNTQAIGATPTLKVYQNYDFVPGNTVLFSGDFTEDQDGEFPSHWTLTKGQAVINQVTGKPTFCLTDGNYCKVYPRMKTTSYLTDPFTVEFDAYTDGGGNESPILFLTFTDKNGNSAEGEVSFKRGDDAGRGDVTTSYFPSSSMTSTLPKQLMSTYANRWHHCAIIYKKGQLKCYVDQYRVLVVPDLQAVPVSLGFGGIGEDGHPIMISNIRIASGGNMNMIGKKFTEAKIITHGITFDIDKSNIKPESMGTLNMIVGVLKVIRI